MYRRNLLGQLEQYLERYPDERARVDEIADFVERHPDCFLRSCAPGHVTGSVWMMSSDRDRCLLVHHRKLGRWLQPGGHADGVPEVHRAAMREAQEETGIWDIELFRPGGDIVPLDVDVHNIPAHGSEPQHLHYDVRFLLLAAPGERPRPNGESNEVRWFGFDEIPEVTREESVLRMARKARQALAM